MEQKKRTELTVLFNIKSKLNYLVTYDTVPIDKLEAPATVITP